jgi:hypothetical protein
MLNMREGKLRDDVWSLLMALTICIFLRLSLHIDAHIEIARLYLLKAEHWRLSAGSRLLQNTIQSERYFVAILILWCLGKGYGRLPTLRDD